jgi:hypothetical protein
LASPGLCREHPGELVLKLRCFGCAASGRCWMKASTPGN